MRAEGNAESDRDGRVAWLTLARSAVHRWLAAAAPTGHVTVLQLEAPLLPLEGALRALRKAVGSSRAELLWDPAVGPGFAAVVESARVAAAAGADALAAARRDAESLWAGVTAVELDQHAGPAPRLFGGVTFSGGTAEDEPWRGFGAGAFALPRLRYARDGRRAWLAVTLDRGGRDAALPELDRAMAALAEVGDGDGDGPRATAGALRVDQLPLARWAALVEDILHGIARGRFVKVVAARRATVTAERPFDMLCIVERLRASAHGCTRFAFRAGEAAFLGATPERLVSRCGATVISEALAGSIDTRRSDAQAALSASTKNLDEHALVVREIARRLAPMCDSLAVAAPPRVRELRHVMHLHTPIEGRLRAPAHILDLVAALHPTPAVCGVPTADAQAWIDAHEPAPRGWYSGPVGWFDAAGDGDFAVALRSAVVSGRRAWLWAGAGIVAGSDAEGEYAETALKQRAMLEALSAGA